MDQKKTKAVLTTFTFQLQIQAPSAAFSLAKVGSNLSRSHPSSIPPFFSNSPNFPPPIRTFPLLPTPIPHTAVDTSAAAGGGTPPSAVPWLAAAAVVARMEQLELALWPTPRLHFGRRWLWLLWDGGRF